MRAPGRSSDTPAARRIAREIADQGPIPFRRFMDIALYGSEVGYYARATAGPGPAADYITSPEVHPAFGALLCGQFEEMWRNLGGPSTFWLIEGGPGSGVFADDVLSTAEAAFPRFSRALRLALIERSFALRTLQGERLRRWGDRVRWIELQDAPLGPGCVFCNELLDALPVHRIVRTAEGLREIYVAGGESFEEVEGDPSELAIEAQLRAGDAVLGDGHRGEVNLEAPRWVGQAAGLVERGYLLLLDYGETASSLYGARHPRGTLRCYWQHTMNEDPLSRVGLQDITAHVDLSSVARAALGAGLGLRGATSQSRLLGRLGIGELSERVADRVTRRTDRRAHRAALGLLADEAALGRITAMVFGQGVPDLPPVGFQRAAPLDPVDVPGIWQLRLDALAAIRSWGARG